MEINHIGIIPDGNRRWAKMNGATVQQAYNKFFDKFVEIVDYLHSQEVKIISFYVASKENFMRSVEELNAILAEFENALSKNILSSFSNQNIKLRFIGDKSLWPKSLLDLLEQRKLNEEQTVQDYNLLVNLLIAYNPIDEINETIYTKKSLCIEDLLIPERVDLIIRSGGQPVRLSNFLPLQSGYAAIHVFDDYFIDIKLTDLDNVIAKYRAINMNFGK
ncbi:MAG: undecaprenyl diphosphate synthase family protein [Firmicutes bacterium]|nr:undecaprenyl diphosphate synthase family protein [Bacillota bacterium]